jgi:hypothetical protein
MPKDEPTLLARNDDEPIQFVSLRDIARLTRLDALRARAAMETSNAK